VARHGAAPRFVLTGRGPVELMQLGPGGSSAGSALLTVVNYAGQRNGRYDDPPLLHGLRLGVLGTAPAEARALVGGRALAGRVADGRTWFDLPPVGAFEAVRLSA